MEKQDGKKKFYKRWWFWVGIVVVLFIIIGESGTPTPKADTAQQYQLLTYKVVDKEDTSYLNCKRIGIRVTVPDDAAQGDVNYTLDQIINDYKPQWDDVTVWAYKNSEVSQVGSIGYTKGMREYSTCK